MKEVFDSTQTIKQVSREISKISENNTHYPNRPRMQPKFESTLTETQFFFSTFSYKKQVI